MQLNNNMMKDEYKIGDTITKEIIINNLTHKNTIKVECRVIEITNEHYIASAMIDPTVFDKCVSSMNMDLIVYVKKPNTMKENRFKIGDHLWFKIILNNISGKQEMIFNGAVNSINGLSYEMKVDFKQFTQSKTSSQIYFIVKEEDLFHGKQDLLTYQENNQ